MTTQAIINDVPPYTQATATAGQTVFSCVWSANAASDVFVYLTPAGDDPDDEAQILSYPSQYTVTFVGALNAVVVTLVTPAAAGDIVTITRQTPADFLNLYTNTNFTPSMLNNDFGILTFVDQQAELVNQLIAPRYNYSAQINNNMLYPTRDTILPLLGSNQFWAMNATNTQIVAVDIGEIISGGTVTEVDTGTGLTGGPITTAGTISFAAIAANTFWGNITGSSAVPTQVATTYFLKSANNLSDLTDVASARANLGLEIGVNVEAWSAKLDSLAGLSFVVNDLLYVTSSTTLGLIAAANNSTLITSGIGVPSLSQTLPSAVQTNITLLGVQAQALDMGGHQITNGADPTQPSDYATKNYVDLNALTGTSVYAASAASLGTVTQSGSGVGATLTNAGVQATFALDGVNPPVNSNVLIKNTATGMTAANEGIYTVTNVGSGATNWVLTRATTYDTAAEINHVGLIIVQNGSTLAGTAWYNAATIVTVDTTAFSYSQFGNIVFPVSLAHGGTNASLTADNGAIVYSTSTALALLASTATAGKVLQSGASAAPTWSTPTYPSASGAAGKIIRSDGTNNVYTTSTFADTYAVSTLLYASSSNTVAGLATTNNAALSTNATGVPTWLALTAGQVVIGSAAGAPLAGTLTAGAGISITNGNNSITVAATGGGLTWSTITASTLSAAIANGYVLNHASTACVVTLPATAAVGDTILIRGLAGSGGWTVTANTGQTIQFGNLSTTTAGSFSSTDAGDCCDLECIVANTTWYLSNAVSQGLTKA